MIEETGEDTVQDTVQDTSWVPTGTIERDVMGLAFRDSTSINQSFAFKASPEGLMIGFYARGVGRGIALIPWEWFEPEVE